MIAFEQCVLLCAMCLAVRMTVVQSWEVEDVRRGRTGMLAVS
jgi:hypothetical protein